MNDKETEMNTTATQTVTVGRKDYGMGVEMTLVEVADREVVVAANGAIFETCGNCDNGYSGSKSHYSHVYSAVCFQCNGRGIGRRFDSIEEAAKVFARRGRASARRAAKAAEEAAASEAKRNAAAADWSAAHPALAVRLTEIREGAEGEDTFAVGDLYGYFITGLAVQARGGLTESQTEAVTEALAEHDAKEAAKAAARHFGDIKEKVVITGTVVTAMNVDGFAYGSTDRLLVIEGTGEAAGCTFKIVGSGQTLWSAEQGDSVSVAATIKKHAEYRDVPQTVLTRAKVTVTSA